MMRDGAGANDGDTKEITGGRRFGGKPVRFATKGTAVAVFVNRMGSVHMRRCINRWRWRCCVGGSGDAVAGHHAGAASHSDPDSQNSDAGESYAAPMEAEVVEALEAGPGDVQRAPPDMGGTDVAGSWLEWDGGGAAGASSPSVSDVE